MSTDDTPTLDDATLAGRTPQPWPPERWPTPQEWADWFVSATPGERLRVADRALEASREAMACFTGGHAHAIRQAEAAEAALAAERARVMSTENDLRAAVEAEVYSEGAQAVLYGVTGTHPESYGGVTKDEALECAGELLTRLRAILAAHAAPSDAPQGEGRGEHFPTTPVQCACGWRETDPGAGTWAGHLASAPVADPDATLSELLDAWGAEQQTLNEAAVEAIAWALIDGSMDTADRAPARETVDEALRDARLAFGRLVLAARAGHGASATGAGE